MTGDVSWAMSETVLVLLLLAAAVAVILLALRIRARRRPGGELDRERTDRRPTDRAPTDPSATDREPHDREPAGEAGPPEPDRVDQDRVDRDRADRAERELGEAREALESVRDNSEGFLDLATHELRSPLSAILGYQELLADGAYGDLDGPMAEAIERIGRSARHLLHLIDGLVELSRIRSGTLHPDVETVNLGVLFSSVADAFRAAARERSLEPHVEMPPGLPSIQSDQSRLLRAFDLLITSAVKYPAGSDITLRVTVAADGITTRIDGTELTPGKPAEDLAVRLGIRLAVVDGMARVLGGALVLEESETGVVRALSLRVRDLGSAPAL